MGLQKKTDELIKAYSVCQKIITVLEQEHGQSMMMYESPDGYVWTFSDRFTVKLDKNGNLS